MTGTALLEPDVSLFRIDQSVHWPGAARAPIVLNLVVLLASRYVANIDCSRYHRLLSMVQTGQVVGVPELALGRNQPVLLVPCFRYWFFDHS